MEKNVASQKIAVYAHDTISDAAKTGDANNITAYISKDNASPVQSNDVNPAELDATNMPGVYVFDLTQAETNCNDFVLYAKSSTSGIAIDIVRLNTTPPNFGLQVVDADGRVDVSKVNGETPVPLSDMTTGARDAILNDATRFSGADIAAILTDTDELITDNIPARIAAIVGDIFDRVGITEGGSWDLTKALTILNAWIAGNWRVKSGESGTQELLDADNGTTVILEMVLSRTSPYRSITVKI